MVKGLLRSSLPFKGQIKIDADSAELKFLFCCSFYEMQKLLKKRQKVELARSLGDKNLTCAGTRLVIG